MEEIVIKVKKKEELLSHIEYVEVVNESTGTKKKQEILKDLDEAVDFVKSYKKGKTKVKSIKTIG